MFRTLSLLIQLNYSIQANLPSCILTDDIGEGLDYTHSTALIKRSAGKAKMYNYLNSKKIFDSFKFTGLGNFDFFSSNYYLKEG